VSIDNALAQMQRLVGAGPLVSHWFVMDQDRIDAFADVTEDRQFIHTDPAAAAQTPFGGTIAHGLLTLSMLSAMYESAATMPEGLTQAVNYGYNRIRFVSPVPAGARIRGQFALTSVTRENTHLTQVMGVTVEIENRDRPALVAEWINRLYFAQ